MRRCLFGALFTALIFGCSGETALVIEVTSPLTVPDDIDRLELLIVGDESGGMLSETFDIETGWPHTYTVRPGSNEVQAVTITVTGRKRTSAGGAGDFIVRRVVRDAFEPGSVRRVLIELTPACVGVRCEDGADCIDGTCMDGRYLDAGMDSGPTDASMDVPPPDAGCVPIDCDDRIDCTVDECTTGVCSSSPDDSTCGADEVCHPATGCGPACSTAAECDDDDPCNGVEECFDRRCISGSPIDCDDGVSCTVDSCDSTSGTCTQTPDDTLCEDGDSCNGAETCDSSSGCTPGAPLDCDDTNDCTVDSCVGVCAYETRDTDMDGHGDALCPPSGVTPADDCDDVDAAVFPGAPELCNAIDDDCDGVIDEAFTCASGSTGSCSTSCGTTGARVCGASCGWSVCSTPPETCNGVDDDCNGVCDDGFACCQGDTVGCTTSCGTTGTRFCNSSCTFDACQPPVEICEDGVDQDCDGIDPLCATCPGGTDAECDDGSPCNGVETCFRNLCAPGMPLTCDDGIRCTVDSCVDAAGGCVFAPDSMFCDDGNFCNGAEACNATMGCLPGSSPTCNDTNSCTDDLCTGAVPGMCSNTTRDSDGDGHGDSVCAVSGGVPADDCNDADDTVFPGAPELCNGTDDDCDGSCDESFVCCRGSTGSCTTSCGTTGSRVCTSVCSWGLCSPPLETCNGIDDDCNTACDDGFACCQGSTGSCLTSCGSMGSRVCNGSCSWLSCTNPSETCSGVDDDCDGTVDEGFTCRAGAMGTCTTSCGSTGVRTCNASCGWNACVAPTEECNGADDDCDGAVDEDFSCSTGTSRSCTTGCGTTGAQTCTSGCSWGACVAPSETCNGTDDDCDTLTDEGYTCVAGSSSGCTASCGTPGSRTCDASCMWGSCNPPVETCNGTDDDCDGTCDDGFSCCRGSMGPCTTSCGTTGSRTCSAACGWGACAPPPEACNSADDDCDGSIDEALECVAGASGSCTTSCGSSGSRTCGASCTWGMCAPPSETCNGVDDDCDSSVDEGFACPSGTTGSCVTSCGTTGSRTCSAACSWGGCSPPAETCNGTDDDCDGTCDDGFSCCRGSTGSCTTSCGSTGNRLCGATCGWGSCTPPSESCNGADDDCDGTPDEDFLCVRGSTGGCLTSCGTTGSRTCNSSCAWGVCLPPTETCNGGDDDCNGFVDEGFTCSVGATASCTTSCGSTGVSTCDSSCGWGSCLPPTETCNGADDDCDGTTDEGFTCSIGAMRSCTAGCGTTGTQTCTSSCTWGTCSPPAESCNGIDDDCDGTCDDGFTCCRGAMGSCTTGCGTTGTRSCSASCTWGSCAPPAESCNGSDDDCDGTCDDGFACCRGSVGSCTTGCGTAGTRSCSSSCTWGSCNPPGESCNGADDDCDGTCDNGFACCAGSSRTCTTSCGSTGSESCTGACGWSGTCVAPSENACNGVDDDCDGTCDEGSTCCQGSTRSCTTSCGSAGSETCLGDCSAWGSCAPPAENCSNGVDDDCDGDVDCDDSNCACGCTACPGATAISAPGGVYTVTLGAGSHGGSCGGSSGSEGNLSLMLAATSDVFITTHGASIDTVIYVRSCSCTGSEVSGGCNDDADGYTTSALRLPALAPGQYEIFIDSKAAMSASLDVHVYATAPGSESDRCGYPTPIPAGSTLISGNTCGFSADYEPVNTTGCTTAQAGDSEDRVYYFVVPSSGTVSFNGGCGSGTYDQTAFVRSICTDGTAPAQKDCNDDSGCSGPAFCNSGRFNSATSTTLSPGIYFFFADGWLSGTPACNCGPYAYSISGI